MSRSVAVLVGLFLFSAALAGETELLKNGDFRDGSASWSDVAVDGDKAAEIVELDGAKALKLTRIKPGAMPLATQYNIKLRPQTLYRLTVTGVGETRAAVSFRPSSAKDPEFQNLCKSWATSAAPMDPSKEPATETFLFDSGLKADKAFLSLRLDGDQPGTYCFKRASLTEVASTKADKSEVVIAHLGDSITITSYLPFSQRIDAVLAPHISKAFPALKVRQLNLGVDGESAKVLLDTGRYNKALKENYDRLDIAIIRYGSNDSRLPDGGGPEGFRKQLARLCDALQRDYPGITLILGTGPCLHNADAVNTKYAPYWQAVRDLAKERAYAVADVYRSFEKEASLKTAKAEGDMHPSPYGVKLAADVEFAALEKILKAREAK